ncbi:hypothetical protein M8C21_010521, partial [Ambrosia artemisiifolia]
WGDLQWEQNEHLIFWYTVNTNVCCLCSRKRDVGLLIGYVMISGGFKCVPEFEVAFCVYWHCWRELSPSHSPIKVSVVERSTLALATCDIYP